MNHGYMLEKANQIVSFEFRNKTDKGGKPYIDHLYRVSNNFRGTKRIVALLHDLLEDCPNWTKENLFCESFTEEVIDAVVCLTKIKNEPYQVYLQRVKSNDIARLVKIEDLKDNMNVSRLNELTDKDVIRLRKYIEALKFLKEN